MVCDGKITLLWERFIESIRKASGLTSSTRSMTFDVAPLMERSTLDYFLFSVVQKGGFDKIQVGFCCRKVAVHREPASREVRGQASHYLVNQFTWRTSWGEGRHGCWGGHRRRRW